MDATECELLAQEQLKIQRDTQRLLQFLVKALGGSKVLETLGLEEVL